MKRLKSSGETRSAESQVFQSSGWLGPHPLAESANENALEPPETTTVITGLEPYTKYKFRVLAVNMAGSVSSAWTTGRTGESGEDQCFELYFENTWMKIFPQIKVISTNYIGKARVNKLA